MFLWRDSEGKQSDISLIDMPVAERVYVRDRQVQVERQQVGGKHATAGHADNEVEIPWQNAEMLQTVNFEALFEEYLSPFEHRYEEAKTAATELWREYSAMSNRLDFLPLDSEEYRSLDTECGVAKAKYDQAHAHANLSYKEWQQERDRNFCVWCFKPVFLDVLVERLQGIAGSIISDIRRVKEGNP